MTDGSDDMREALKILARIAENGSGISGTHGRRTRDDDTGSTGRFNDQVKKITGGMSLMHGGIEDFRYGLSNAVKGFVGLEVAVAAFTKVLEIGKTFSKMTDIGQSFNGSLFMMMQQVGQAGLSLDEFAALMSRNSMATSAVGTKSMGSLQLAVRGNLQQFGFYGMALDEITNTTSDYMETLRQSGNETKLDDVGRKRAVVDLISQASQMTQVFGKSRAEIIKTTNEAMRTPELLARLNTGTEAQISATQSFVTAYAGQSEILAKTFAEQAGKGGYIDTEVGKAAIESGLGEFNEIMQSNIELAHKGIKPTAEKLAQDAQQYKAMFNKDRMENLLTLSKVSPAAKRMLDIGNEINASYQKFTDAKTGVFDTQGFIKAQENAAKQAEITDGITKIATMFESAFKEVTGSFIDGFYTAFTDVMKMFGQAGSGGFETAIEGLKTLFNTLGKVLGVVVGIIVKASTILGPVINQLADLFSGNFAKAFGLGGTDDDKDGDKKSPGGLPALVATLLPIIGLWILTGRFRSMLLTGTIGAVSSMLTKIPGVSKLMGGGTGFNGDCCAELLKELRSLGGRGNLHGNVGKPGKPAGTHKTEEHAAADALKKKGFLGKLAGIGGKAKGWLGKAAGLAAPLVGATGLGGDGCCDEMSQGLSNLTDRVDFHGDRAHANSTTLKSVAGAGAKDAEDAMAKASVLGKIEPQLADKAAVPGKIEPQLAGTAGATAVKEAEKVAGTGLKTFGKLATGFAKKLPAIGLAFGAYEAYQSAQQGDYLGAAGNVASGLLSLTGPLGAFASIAIDAGLAMRDHTKAVEADTTKQPTDPYYNADTDRVRADSTGSTGPATQAQADKEDAETTVTTRNQISRMARMYDDLYRKETADEKSGDVAAAKLDAARMNELLAQIAYINGQQLKQQKDSDDKTQAAQQQIAVFGAP